MADIVNLRTARKAKTRETKMAQADANRAAFGRTRAECGNAVNDVLRHDRILDGAKLDR